MKTQSSTGRASKSVGIGMSWGKARASNIVFLYCFPSFALSLAQKLIGLIRILCSRNQHNIVKQLSSNLNTHTHTKGLVFIEMPR